MILCFFNGFRIKYPTPLSRLGFQNGSSTGQLHRHLRCCDQVLLVRNALPGDVKRGAMVHGGSNDGKPKGCVDRVAKPRNFTRNVPLVMVQCDHGIKLALVRSKEHRVGRHGFRADPVPAIASCLVDRWLDNAGLLVPKNGLAVGVQPSDGNARLLPWPSQKSEITS